MLPRVGTDLEMRILLEERSLLEAGSLLGARIQPGSRSWGHSAGSRGSAQVAWRVGFHVVSRSEKVNCQHILFVYNFDGWLSSLLSGRAPFSDELYLNYLQEFRREEQRLPVC